MSPAAEPGRASDPAALTRAVDQVCDRFEAAWRSGQRPRLEALLAAVPEPDQPDLLRELLPIEVDYRRAEGEDCQAEEYRARFPELEPAWLAEVLAEEATRAAGAAQRYRALR